VVVNKTAIVIKITCVTAAQRRDDGADKITAHR